MESIEEKQQHESTFAYTASIVGLWAILALVLCLGAMTWQKITGWSFSLIGTWIDLIGVLAFSAWSNPETIAAWSGNGIDMHPEDIKRVLLLDECKKYPIWKQTNRCKLIIVTIIVLFGLFIQALDQTNDYYQQNKNQTKLIDLGSLNNMVTSSELPKKG